MVLLTTCTTDVNTISTFHIIQTIHIIKNHTYDSMMDLNLNMKQLQYHIMILSRVSWSKVDLDLDDLDMIQ